MKKIKLKEARSEKREGDEQRRENLFQKVGEANVKEQQPIVECIFVQNLRS